MKRDASCKWSRIGIPLFIAVPLLVLYMLYRAPATPPSVEFPSVCIIMPTNSRPEFVEHAIEMISRQDYPAEISEVVIVDDSDAALRVPSLSAGQQDVNGLTIDYVILHQRLSVGEKRNQAVDRCTGEVVVHWDDDDLYGASRLSQQLAPIAEHKADATVLQHTFTYFLDRDELFAARGKPGAMSGCVTPGCGMTARPDFGPHFGTLAYRRDRFVASAGVAFPDTSEAEDYFFAQKMVQSGGTLHIVRTVEESREPAFVCVRHGSNTWAWANEAGGRFDSADFAVRLPSSLLHRSDYAFAKRMRSEGIPAALRSRRLAAPAPHRSPPVGVDRSFFDHLYAGATSSDERASWLASMGTSGGKNATIRYFEVGKLWEWGLYGDCLQACYKKLGKWDEAKCNKQCVEKWHFATYDLVTDVQCGPAHNCSGGAVGYGPTSLASHGGNYYAKGNIKLSSDLYLVYYTTLVIAGELDANGYSIVVDSFATLTVQGSIVNAQNVTLGAFATLNTSGSVIASGSMQLAGGGVCDWYVCDNHSWPFPPGAIQPYGPYTRQMNVSLIRLGGKLTATALMLGGCCSNVSVVGAIAINSKVSVGLQTLLRSSASIGINGSLDVQPGYGYLGSIGLFASEDVDVYGRLSAYDGSVSVDGTMHVRGDASWYTTTSRGTGLTVKTMIVDGTMWCSRCFDVSTGGKVTVGNLTLGSMSHMSTTSGLTVRDTLKVSAGGSLAASAVKVQGDVLLYPTARLAVFSMQVQSLTIYSGALLDATGEPLVVDHLRMLSGSQFSTLSTTLTIKRRVELAPHVLMQCQYAKAFTAAGSGIMGQPPTPEENASAICPWPANLYDDTWEAHQPPQKCNAALNTCGANHSTDYNASWLYANYLGRSEFSCLTGTDGRPILNVYSSFSSNLSLPCSP